MAFIPDMLKQLLPRMRAPRESARGSPPRTRMHVEEVEPRILHSADLAPGLGELAVGPVHVRMLDSPTAPDSTAGQTSRTHELIVVDGATEGYELLVADLVSQAASDRSFDVLVIDLTEDGIARLSAALSDAADLDAIHVISHGNAGEFRLGATTIDIDEVTARSAEIAAWAKALAPDADFVIYGCDVAASADGRALLERLGRLTAADIAASDDATGSAALGGDWALEYAFGQVESPLVPGQNVLWTGLLDVTTLQAAQDTYVKLKAPDNVNNFGASTQLVVDRETADLQRALLKFDLSGIPAGATINSATLQMQSTQIGGALNIGVYEVLESWTEGTGSGTAGAANWNQRSAGTNWSSAGGAFAAAATSTINATATGQHSWNVTSLVQSWVNGSKTNNGVMVASPDGGGNRTVTYDSREGAMAPRLVIDYTVGASSGAPGLNGANDLSTIPEDASPNNGTPVSALIATHVTDPDAGALTGIAVTAVDNTNGVWQYSTNAGTTWNAFGSPTASAARLLAADANTSVRFVPNAEWSGTVTNGITFRAWDQTSGIAGSTADTTVGSFNVLDNFSAVSYSNNNGSETWSGSWSDGDGATSGSITVTGGRLQLQSDLLLASDSVSRAVDLSAATSATLSFSYDNQLVLLTAVKVEVSSNGGASYTTLANSFAGGSGTASYDISSYASAGTRIRFSVSSTLGGGTFSVDNVQIAFTRPLNGGATAFSSQTASASVQVSAVNDAPVNGVPGPQSTPRDTPLTFSAANSNGIAASDTDAGAGAVRVTLTATNGTITLAWPSITATPTGPEFRINTTTGDRQATLDGEFYGATTGDFGGGRAVASDSTGNFIVTWSSKNQDGAGWGVYAQRYDSAGAAIGGEFRVNTTTAKNQVHASVATDDAGHFVVVWSSQDQDGDNWGVYAQRFDSSGAALGSEFRVNTYTTKEQLGATVAMDRAGNFVVAWSSKDEDGNGWGIYAQRFDASGATVGGAFRVNGTTSKDQTAATIAIAEDGRFVIAWSSQDQDSDNWGVYAKRYDAAGVPQGGEFRVNTVVAKEQEFPSVAMDAAGNFVVTWSSKDQDGNNWGVYAQRYDATGAARGGAFQVNLTTAQEQMHSSVAMDADGDFVVTWTSNGQDGGGRGVYARQYNAGGVAKGAEVRVNTTTAGDQEYSSVAMDPRGNFVVVWTGAGPGDTLGVFGQRFAGPNAVTFTAGDGTRDGTMTFAGSLVQVNSVLNGLVFTPDAGFNGLATLAISTNDQGNAGSGGAQADTDTIAITVGNSNVDPALTLSPGALAYTENDAPAVIDGSATVADPDSADFDGGRLTVLLTGGGTDDDRLSVRNQGTATGQVGVSGSNVTYNFGSGAVVVASLTGGSNGITPLTVTFNANATVEAVQAVTRNVTYEDVSENPSSLPHIVEFLLTDGDGGSSTSASRAIATNPVNDAPVNTLPGAQATTEDSAGIVFSAATGNVLSIADADAGPNPIRVTLTATGGTVSLARLTGLTFVSGTGTGEGTMTFTAAASDINAALDGLVFVPAPNYSGAATLQIVTDDQGFSGGPALTDTDTIAITVNAAADAPTLVAGATVTLTGTNEDTTSSSSAVSSILAAAGWADADPGAQAGLAVTAMTGTGTWQYSTDGAAWTAFGSVTPGNALTLDAAAVVRYVPDGIDGGTATFTFRAWDPATGVASSSLSPVYVDAGTGAAAAFSSASASASLTIAAVNDAPTATNDTFAVNEDGVLNVGASGILANDSDIDSATLTATVVSTTPNGTLTLHANGSFTYAPHANFNGTDTFTYKVSDGASNSNTATVTITVAARNDAPAGANATVTIAEDTSVVLTAAAFGFSDANDTPADNLAAVRIAATPTAGTLALNGTAVSFGQLISAADIAAGNLVFTPGADANGSAYAQFRFQVQDDGGTANGGSDLDAIARTLTIDVTPVNDAPSGTTTTVGTAENTPFVFDSAVFGFSDPKDAPADGLQAVVIVAPPAAGTLTLSGVLVTAGASISAADLAAGNLVFTPALNASGAGYATLTFQVQDTGGTANGGADLDPIARTLVIDVGSINHAPTGHDNTVSTLEDCQIVFDVSQFGFDDSRDTPRNNLQAVEIDSLPALGTLTLAGAPVTPGQSILASDIATGRLAFTPATNGNGAGYASFTFRVQDDGGTANGGTDLDAAARTMTIDVTAVNDAPAGSDRTVTALEDTPFTLQIGDFGLSDPDDAGANGFAGVRIAGVPVTGTLALAGSAVGAGQFVTAADIAAGKLVFTGSANASGSGYASLTFQVQDDGGTANGGVDLDPVARTLTIDVTPVNDPPAATDNTIIAREDTPFGFTAADFGFTDPLEANGFSGVVIGSLPLKGALTLSGSAVTTGQRIDAADITAGKLVFTSAADANGLAYASFTFRVQDDGGVADGGADLDPTARTMTIDVIAVNDAPSGGDRTVSVLEDSAVSFRIADFGFSDAADGDAFFAVRITTVPAAGTLALAGASIGAGQLVSAADISAGKLVFTPDANAAGAAYASFTFQVQDDGGNANGGADLDTTAHTMTIDVTAVNDAPSGAGKTLATNEDTTLILDVSDFGFVDALEGNGLRAVRIAALPLSGSLTLDGSPVSAGQSIDRADIAAGKLAFIPGANANGAACASFSFQVQDDGGIANSGIDLDPIAHTLTIDVTAVNDAPAGGDNTVIAHEDTPFTFTAAHFRFTDALEGNNLSSVTIDSLPVNGVLTLNGAAVTAVQRVDAADITAGKLVFMPGSNANGAGYATFTFRVQDDGGIANGGTDVDFVARTMTIDVTAVNDAPSGANKTAVTNEDTPLVFGVGDFGFGDSADGNALAAVKIAAGPAAGTLALAGTPIVSGQLVSAADIAAGRLVFTPGADQNGPAYASFTFQVQDDGGTAAGGNDLDIAARTMTLDVTAINDAPSGANTTVTTNEDTALVLNVADFGFNDVVEANGLLAVKITALPVHGSLALDGTAVAAGQSITAADLAAGKLAFTPAANESGASYATFSFHVQDDGGTANGGIDLDPIPHTITVDVTAVNDPPAATDATVSALEDTPFAFRTTDFGFTDTVDADSFAGVRISTLPAAGPLTLSGAAMAAGQFVSASDIAAGRLVFTAAANANGAGYASFSFQVQDDGGTAGGGIDLDPVARTMTIDVAAVNDAPAGAGKTVTAMEDTPFTLQIADFGLTDPDDGGANALARVRITSVPLAGTLSVNGATVAVGQFVGAGDIAAGKLVFTPAAQASGSSYASFTFQVQDDGGIARGGIDLDPVARTLTIDVTPVNDAPSGRDSTVLASEDTPFIFSAAHFGFSDALDANNLAGVVIGSVPTAGALTLNGVAVTGGQLVAAADIAAGKLVFTSAANGNGTAYASFTFQVQDDGGTANGGTDLDPVAHTVTIDVAAVNDAPTGADTRVSLLEDTAYAFMGADFGFSDRIDGDSLAAVKIGTLPAAGTLALSGAPVAAGQFVSAADLRAGKLTYTPLANASGTTYASLTFQVQDDGGVANGGTELEPVAHALTLDVIPVNDAPSGMGGTLVTSEDTTLTFTAADFGFTDTLDGDAFSGITIATPAGAGTLTLNGTAIAAGQFVSAADIAAGRLAFTPAPNGNGAAYASFAFHVRDDGGTANGGIDTDPIARALVIDVTPVDDAPTAILPGAQSIGFGQQFVFSASRGVAIGLTDVDGGSTAMEITLSVANAKLTLARTTGLTFSGGTGVADASMTFTGTLSDINAALDGLVLAPATDFSGATALHITANPVGAPPGGTAILAAVDVRVLAPAPELRVDDSPVAPVILSTPPADIGTPSRTQSAPLADSEPQPARNDPPPALAADAPQAAEEPQLLARGATEVVGTGGGAFQSVARSGNAVEGSRVYRLDGGSALVEPNVLLALYTDAPAASNGSLATAASGPSRADRIAGGETLIRELESLREEMRERTALEVQSVAVSAAATLGLSVGYVMWLLRGGVLLGSFLSSLPAWRLIDPLPVLGRLDDDEEDETDESFESIVARTNAPARSTGTTAHEVTP